MSICAAFTFFTAFLALGLRALLVWENKKFDEKYGSVLARATHGTTTSMHETSEIGEENYGPTFRYIL